MKSNYLLILFLFLSSFGFAQGYDIAGVVKETGSGIPIPGVNVQVKNSTMGTATDIDFLKKIKAAHPSLTSNDLRLCAYLRLNLSSNEGAPVLNISVRSVEIKRYRLRKKMELSHEQGLVEYILAV